MAVRQNAYPAHPASTLQNRAALVVSLATVVERVPLITAATAVLGRLLQSWASNARIALQALPSRPPANLTVCCALRVNTRTLKGAVVV